MSRLSSAKPVLSNHNNVVMEGWGDEIAHYYVVEDMLKLNPGQLMHLFDSVTGFNGDCTVCGSKSMVESYVAGLGDWLENNGETLAETIGFVVGERGGDVTELKEFVEAGWAGIARREE